MFKNRLDAARQLKKKLDPDLIQKNELKIVGLTPGGNKIADYLNKLFNILPSNNNHQASSVLIVDDGTSQLEKFIKTIKFYRQSKVKKIIIGIPVYKLDHLLSLQKHADAVYAVYKPKTFISIEEFYHDLE